MVGYTNTLNFTAASQTKALPLPEPYARSFALQVKGVGAAPTSWTVNLEGSIDGVNWTLLVAHNSVDGSTVWAVDKPVTQVRVNVSALVLGGATAINVGLLAVP
jgi:hypothetical protein